MSKYYAILGGGLGDALMHYLRTPFFKKLPALKQVDPNLEVYIYSQVHNNGIEDLFWYNPYVKRHIQIVQIPQHIGYESFDRSLISFAAHPCDIAPTSDLPETDSIINLNDDENRLLDSLFEDGQPVTVIQPYAGLTDRDAFNHESLKTLVEQLPGKKIILGKNAPRVYRNRIEAFPYQISNVINLIDQVGIRFSYHLLKRCHAFIGCHSSLILLSWYFNKPTVCILPLPAQLLHWQNLGGEYKMGADRPNTLIAQFETVGGRCPEDYNYETLNYNQIKEHIERFI